MIVYFQSVFADYVVNEWDDHMVSVTHMGILRLMPHGFPIEPHLSNKKLVDVGETCI